MYFQVTELFFTSLLLSLISSSVKQTTTTVYHFDFSAPIRPL